MAGCGAAETPRTQIDYEARLDLVTAQPYEFTCGDERHVNRYGKRAYFALADDAQIPNLNRLRAAHSIFYAVTEVCKGKPDDYKPAREAVAGVRKGVYRAALGSETIVP